MKQECKDFIPFPNECCGSCDWKNTNCVYHPTQEHDAAIRKDEREMVMTLIYSRLDDLSHHYEMFPGDCGNDPVVDMEDIKKLFEELRKEQTPSKEWLNQALNEGDGVYRP